MKAQYIDHMGNDLSVVNQRSDPHAQQEVQELAQQVAAIIAPIYPVSWQELTRPQVSTNA